MLKKFGIVLTTFVLASCSNPFEYQPNNWLRVSETRDENPQVIYLDKNRIECKDGKCKTWLKMVFGRAKAIPFAGDKPGEISGNMMVKRIDAAVDYDCRAKTARINAYQLYDSKEKMIDKKWINGELEYAKAGTVHGDVLKHVCK
ncbi:MAG: hypothetical protein OXU45_09990 [Candidatus Melainabacteria bacterium]|nr:hypothetical protein [Candidatus Melainabacteria bacterium]